MRWLTLTTTKSARKLSNITGRRFSIPSMQFALLLKRMEHKIMTAEAKSLKAYTPLPSRIVGWHPVLLCQVPCFFGLDEMHLFGSNFAPLLWSMTTKADMDTPLFYINKDGGAVLSTAINNCNAYGLLLLKEIYVYHQLHTKRTRNLGTNAAQS